LLSDVAFSLSSQRLSYREAFLQQLQLDPLTASMEQLTRAARAAGFNADSQANAQSRAGAEAGLGAQSGAGAGSALGADGQRDELLELLMGTVIGPALGHSSLTFIHDYPAGQAALARVNPNDSRTALRFELYCKGIELANGFQELASADEQRARFQRDNEERVRLGLPTYPLDERLLAALSTGLPECAGVALGFDRTLMLAAEAAHIDDVLPFPTDRA
jgi:lysyl-tRNA synthetase class 2